jgi:UDP-2-acetamido-2-deoxy-ribo-hexuluronate aminotransferase
MDTLQCAVVLAKLERFDWEIERRQEIARAYDELLGRSRDRIQLLKLRPDRTSAYAQYTVLVDARERFRATLHSRGIPTAVHYPIPLHQQPAYAQYGVEARLSVAETVAAQVLSLPMYPDMPAHLQTIIAEAVQAAID